MSGVNWPDLLGRVPPAIGAVLVGFLLATAVGAFADMSAVEVLIGVPEPTKLSREQIRGGLFAIAAAAGVIAAGLAAWVLIAWFQSRESDSQ